MKNKFNSTTMKTMNNFAAQQLSKKQMNDVKGGNEVFSCRFTINDVEQKTFIYSNSGQAASQQIMDADGRAVDVTCIKA